MIVCPLIFEDSGVPTSSLQLENTSFSGPFPVVRLKISNNTYGWSTYPLLVKPLVYLNKTGYETLISGGYSTLGGGGVG